jgi:hypothetical protein
MSDPRLPGRSAGMTIDITVVLDRSGSMAPLAGDVVGGLNTFINTQQQVEGEARFTLVQFDDCYEVVHFNVPLREVPQMTATDFVPRGTTALLDALGRTILQTSARIDALPPSARPDRVVVAVQTDGHENSSREFTRAEVFEMIRQREDAPAASGTPCWEFVFLAANQDAIAEGGRLGFAAARAVDFDAGGDGVQRMYRVMAAKVAAVRSARATMDYTPEDRARTRRSRRPS